MGQDKKPEVILKQHRRWTHWLAARRIVGEGNLVLTNRRLLFLHRIGASPEVHATIKKLADAPIETVLNHALTMHKNCLEIPLTSIARVSIGSFFRFPFPYFYLRVYYLKGKKHDVHTAAFQFRWPKPEIILHPQLIEDWKWMKAIKQAMKASA